MASTKRIPPGEILAVIKALRGLLAAYDTAAFVIDGSLEVISVDAEILAKTLRPQLRDTANGTYELLAKLEDLPSYKRVRQDALRQRRYDD